MADAPTPPPPPGPAKPSGRSKSGGFGKRGRKAPPVVLKTGEGAPPEATRRRIRTLTLGLGAAGAAALAAYAAHQYSTRDACEEAIRQGQIVGPECPTTAAEATTPSHATTSHSSSSHWTRFGLNLLVGPSFRSSSSPSSHVSTSSGGASTHGFSFGGFGSHGSAHGGGS